MGTPVTCTDAMRMVRPGYNPTANTFNVHATHVIWYRPALATNATDSRYWVSINRAGDTLGMECAGSQVYGPVPLNPGVEYISMMSDCGTEHVRGGWVVPIAHNSMNF